MGLPYFTGHYLGNAHEIMRKYRMLRDSHQTNDSVNSVTLRFKAVS